MAWYTPPVTLSVSAGPMSAPPSSNCTVPVGVPVAPPTGVTIAVNVTVCPVAAGLGVASSEVVVDAACASTAPMSTAPLTIRAKPAAPLIGRQAEGSGRRHVAGAQCRTTGLQRHGVGVAAIVGQPGKGEQGIDRRTAGSDLVVIAGRAKPGGAGAVAEKIGIGDVAGPSKSGPSAGTFVSVSSSAVLPATNVLYKSRKGSGTFRPLLMPPPCGVPGVPPDVGATTAATLAVIVELTIVKPVEPKAWS